MVLDDHSLSMLNPPCLRSESDGSVRVGTSRFTLDLIVEQYECGMSPEEMVRAYDSLKLADVYSAIGFYLGNRESVQEYLARRQEQAAPLREKIELERPRISRAELLTRQAARESVDAAAGQ